ncbi:Flagellar hook-associated protein 3 [[Clostridium] ultunense Esp]|nr:Flagellar hook-associated protein 3 [[Clostridium] ultunense Esp]
MRVTQNMLTNRFLLNLNNSMNRLDRLQEQLSSGKKVSKPSEDPVIAVRSIAYNSQIKVLNQYKRNLDTANNWIQTTDAVLQEADNLFKTIREKMVQGANGAMDPQAREAIAREMEQIKEQLGSIANTSIAGRYIFAGSDTLKKPYDNGALQTTNAERIPVELGKGISMDLNIPGVELFGFQDTSGRNVFQFLDEVVNALDNNGDVGALLGNLQEHENHFLKIHSGLGANMNRLDMIQNRLDAQIQNTTELLSKEEDADLAQVIINLNMQENVHRAALGAGARIMQPTLMDFLR